MTPQPANTPRKRSFFDLVERLGNALPDPMTLFALGSVAVFLVSWWAESQGWRSQLYDANGKLVLDEQATNLLSAEGFRWLFQNLITIFVQFRPLGLVLVAAIGIAVAEKSGLITAGLKSLLVYVKPSFLTPATFFAGVMSSMAVDAGYIVLPPLAAVIYRSMGRSPLVGIAAVVAGVGAGFNANLFITGLDPMLSGLTEQAAGILDPEYRVNPACNWYFMIVSTILITGVGWAVTAWFVEPRVARKTVEEGGPTGVIEGKTMKLEPRESRGLLWAFVSTLATLAFFLLCQQLDWGFLYDAPGSIGGPGQSPFPTWISVIVPLILVLFLVPGIVYGIYVGTIRSDRDVVKMMNDYMSLLGSYIVLAFFAAIFVEAFARSNLGRMLAVEGGNFLRAFDLPNWGLMLGFIVVTAFINMFIGSMSAKWAMLATIFVPMFMTLGISPELTQVAYRVGDSVTNPVTPLNPYMVVVLVFMQQHVKKAGFGTLISVTLPYSITFFVIWSIMLAIWIALGLPLGPGGPLQYG